MCLRNIPVAGQFTPSFFCRFAYLRDGSLLQTVSVVACPLGAAALCGIASGVIACSALARVEEIHGVLGIGLRNLDVVMGLENRIVYNLVDVVEGNCRIKQAMIKDKKYPNLFLLPSAQTRDKTSVTPEQMSKLVEELKSEFDYIILDCPAGIEQGFKNAIAAADRALIVTTPEVSAIRDADRIIGLLEANDIHKIDLVINRIRMDMVERGDMLSKDDVLDILAVDLIGIVPDDENIVISTNQGEPLVGSNTPAGKAYQNICNRVMGKDVPFMEITGPTFFQRLANVFKK